MLLLWYKSFSLLTILFIYSAAFHIKMKNNVNVFYVCFPSFLSRQSTLSESSLSFTTFIQEPYEFMDLANSFFQSMYQG